MGTSMVLEKVIADHARLKSVKLTEQDTEMDVLRQELEEASLKIQQEKETAAIFKQKYFTAIEKVHKQGESESATRSLKKELAELERRHQEKVGQWEISQEAFALLTDDLQTSQNILRETQQRGDHFKNLARSLQEQMDTLIQQKLVVERDFCQQNHSEEEYVSLSRATEQQHKCCAEQVERLAECEKALFEMKSELARRSQEEEDLRHRPAASHCRRLSNRSQLGHKVVTRLQLKLADAQKVHMTIFAQEEEEEQQLKEAKQESARRDGDVDAQRGQVQRLQEKFLKEEEEKKSAIRENQRLSTYSRQLKKELDEIRNKYKVTVEELAARAEEARRMEGCLTEGKLAEEKIRSMAMRLEKEVGELRENLQQAVDHKLKAERQNKDAQELVETLQTELEGTRLDNANLRHKSQEVLTNVKLWIREQMAASESLAAQTKAQNKVLLITTGEKAHLQEANDTLKVEVKRLKGVLDEKERDTQRLKAQIRDGGIRQGGKTTGKRASITRNLDKIEDMHCKLQSNLQAISMLNQQLNVLCRENEWLRRQLEEERSIRRQVEQQLSLPPSSHHCSHHHPPLSLCTCPPPGSTSLSSFTCHPSNQPETGDTSSD
ncbi:polyamine-modulated factor 1-binding protein 1-like [Cololabis saira]|uniref:polyamine-modulated factor 1-binding protein 1-like n=1 Tax=Cololabis saira TaxID=129043 RepID=UPI002AD2BCEE|nr:polyamine-modulated factor 1-binding protein 1-like [Cololabis saira]